jgi:hypothetical protein
MPHQLPTNPSNPDDIHTTAPSHMPQVSLALTASCGFCSNSRRGDEWPWRNISDCSAMRSNSEFDTDLPVPPTVADGPARVMALNTLTGAGGADPDAAVDAGVARLGSFASSPELRDFSSALFMSFFG